METAKAKTITSTTPQCIIQHFCQSYTFEEVQEALWHSQHPHLLATFNELDPLHTDKLTVFYENIEILLSAVYQLPDLPPPPQEQEPTLTLYFAGDQRHV
ncbi:hypothetical protein [Pontibacter sp. H249]|uniref:hypothetical protein n=1 Tax=Pontibacter sp. H249 TaxID=3133420 RepID=UPI0030C23389